MERKTHENHEKSFLWTRLWKLATAISLLGFLSGCGASETPSGLLGSDDGQADALSGLPTTGDDSDVGNPEFTVIGANIVGFQREEILTEINFIPQDLGQTEKTDAELISAPIGLGSLDLLPYIVPTVPQFDWMGPYFSDLNESTTSPGMGAVEVKSGGYRRGTAVMQPGVDGPCALHLLGKRGSDGMNFEVCARLPVAFGFENVSGGFLIGEDGYKNFLFAFDLDGILEGLDDELDAIPSKDNVLIDEDHFADILQQIIHNVIGSAYLLADRDGDGLAGSLEIESPLLFGCEVNDTL